jgi:hypothetical protein
MVFNATFSNILIILWRSVLLLEENGVHVLEKTTGLSQVTDKFYHIILSSTPRLRWICSCYVSGDTFQRVSQTFYSICTCIYIFHRI